MVPSSVMSWGIRARFRTVLKVLALLAHVAVVAADVLCSGPSDDSGYRVFLSGVQEIPVVKVQEFPRSWAPRVLSKQ